MPRVRPHILCYATLCYASYAFVQMVLVLSFLRCALLLSLAGPGLLPHLPSALFLFSLLASPLCSSPFPIISSLFLASARLVSLLPRSSAVWTNAILVSCSQLFAGSTPRPPAPIPPSPVNPPVKMKVPTPEEIRNKTEKELTAKLQVCRDLL